MVNEAGTKQSRYVCPKGCDTVRLLNAGVNLALCPKCYTMMISEFSRNRIKPKSKELWTKKPTSSV